MPWRIRWLVVAHAIAAAGTVVVDAPALLSEDARVICLHSWVHGQLALVAIWLAVEISRWRWRFAGIVAAAVAYALLELATILARNWYWRWQAPTDPLLSHEHLSMVAIGFPMTAFVVFAAMKAVIWANAQAKTRLTRITSHGACPAAPTQFSLWQLLSILTVVAVLLATGRVIRSLPQVPLNGGQQALMFVCIVCVLAFKDSMIAVTAAWCGLRASSPLRGMFVAIPLMATAAALLSLHGSTDPGWIAQQAAAGVVAWLIAFGSLLVVRSCGYRLVASVSASQIGETGAC